KPENVLVAEGQVHILDFGLATRQDESAVGSSGGSAAYLALELWREQPPSPASDLYALGVMAYELLTDQHPFAPIDDDFLDRVLDSEPDLSLLGIAEGPVQVIAKLLVKEPSARYQHARAVLSDLSTALGQPQPVESQAIRESYLQAATFVGREAEMAQLTEVLTQVEAGQGAIWLIGGESGVGKSRLVDELRIQAMVKGIAVMRGQAVEGGGLPFQLWREPVRRLLLMHQDIPTLQAGILKDLVPDIDNLLDREVPVAPKLDGRAYQQRLILTIVDLFRALPGLVLLLEDLQWTSESLTVLQQMLQVIEQLPGVMVLGTYRHDERPNLPEELFGSQSLILTRLDESEVAQLSQAMLGEAANSPHIVSLLTQETEGNTFFIVEVMRALAEEAGQLDDIGTMTLPVGVFTGGMARLLQRRIQQVAEADQPLLQLAAVAGRQLDVVLLRVLAPDIDLTAWQQRVGDAAVLTIRDNQWWFAHDKLREVLLAELDGEEKRELHRQVAEALETIYPEDSNYNEALLGHWHQAGDLDKETHYLDSVAENLIMITAEYERVQTLLDRGLAQLSQDDTRCISLWHWKAQSLRRQGKYTEGEAVAQVARSLAQQVKDQAGLVKNLNLLGIIADIQKDYAAARDYFQQSLAIHQALDNQQGIANSLNNLGLFTYYQGDYAVAHDYCQQSMAINQALGNPWGIANSLINLGFVHLYLHSDQVRPSLHKALVIAQDIQAIPLILETVVGFAAWLYMHVAQLTRAGELVGLGKHHPDSDSDVQQRLDEVLPKLEAALPPAELKVALARGKALDLDTVVAELLAEFGETDR
ncbi:MAG: tetratricopeptide repeat protein, partial [Gammaproteobacteria bacterium]|nr:tetratricopeptide repeat protein [Gammaproteobacteria bacterium]